MKVKQKQVKYVVQKNIGCYNLFYYELRKKYHERKDFRNC